MRPRYILVFVYRPYHDGTQQDFEQFQARYTPEAVFIEAIDEHGDEGDQPVYRHDRTVLHPDARVQPLPHQVNQYLGPNN